MNGSQRLIAAALGLFAVACGTDTPVEPVPTPAKLAFAVPPSSATSAAPLSPAIQVAVQSASGATVTSATTVVTIAVGTNAGGGTLTGSTSATAVNGIATFPNLSIDKAGTGYTLVASATGLTSATSAAFNITPGPPAKLAFAVQPTSATSAVAISPALQVSVQDAQSNTVTSATASITMALGTNAGSGTLSGTLTVPAVSGVATFSNLTIDKAGASYTLVASATGLTSGTSTAFNVAPGPASKLAFEVQPTNATSAVAISPGVAVTVQDAQGNAVTSSTTSIAIAIGTNPGSGTLFGNTTATATNGVASFAALSIDKAGVGYTLTASATGLTGATSNAFNIAAGSANKLVFAVQPTNAASTAAINPAVQVAVQDAQSNVVTSATTSVTIAIGTNANGGTLSGTRTVSAVNGVATFSNLGIDKAGTGYTLTASATALASGTSGAFNVTAGAATKLAFGVQPTNATSGAAISPGIQVVVQDAQSNTVTSATTSITVAIGTNAGGGTLSGTATAAATAGVATLSTLSINKAGSGYTLTASATGLSGATSNAFNVTAGAAAKLVFNVQPSSATSATAISPAVQVAVQDAQGNTVAGATTSITIAIGTNAGSGALSGTVTTSAANGIATFSSLSIDKAGTGYTLTASASGLTGATSSAFNIAAGPAAMLAFTVQPTHAISVAAISPAPQVTVQDAQGNAVTSATTSITVTIGTNAGSGTLAGTATVVAVSGVATFSDLSIDKVGAGYTLAASASGLTGATSGVFNITPGAAAKLAFGVQPTNATSAVAISPALQVIVQDAQGNTVTTATASIAIAIGTNPGSGALSGTATAAAVGGIATFSNLRIDKVGAGYTLAASATALTGATSSAFNIAPAAASKVAFSVQPTNATSAATIAPAPQVTIQDAQENTVTSSTINVTIAIGTNAGNGVLSGTATVAAVNGVATFSTLSIDKAGTGYTLAASAAGLTGATSGTFNISAGAASILAFSVQPTSSAAAVSISPAPQVTVQDAQGNTVSTSTAIITVAIATGTGKSGATLSGTTTVAASSGVATFATLSIDSASSGYQLRATATGLTSATSTSFSINPGAATTLAFSAQPGNVAVNDTISPSVKVVVRDAVGNTVTNAANTVQLTFDVNPSSATLGGSVSQSPTSGVITYSNLTVSNAGIGYRVKATGTNLTTATSNLFNVHAFRSLSVTTIDCAIRTDSLTYCWGGGGSDRFEPRLMSSSLHFASISIGRNWSCGVTAAGELYCWLYFNGPERKLASLTVKQVSNGSTHSCLLTTTDAVYCWDQDYGQSGPETAVLVATPVALVSITAGYRHTCGLTVGGVAYCWGVGTNGELGVGDTVTRTAPTLVAGGLAFASLTAGGYHTCGLTADGTAYCWGDNEYGQLGNNNSGSALTPSAVAGGLKFTTLSTAPTHTCGLTSAGVAYCWGMNARGQLGTGSLDGLAHRSPEAVSGGLTFTQLTVGSDIFLVPSPGAESCGLDSSGRIFCWGQTFGSTPTRYVIPPS